MFALSSVFGSWRGKCGGDRIEGEIWGWNRKSEKELEGGNVEETGLKERPGGWNKKPRSCYKGSGMPAQKVMGSH